MSESTSFDGISKEEWHDRRMERLEDYKKITEAAIGKKQLHEAYRQLALNDLFFLMVYILDMQFANNDWVFRMCQVVSAKPDECIDIWSREHYKDCASLCSVKTYNRGWVNHGDLVVGDYVYSPSGKPVKVLALSPKYTNNTCMEVTFQGGEKIVCGHTHLWRVIDKKSGKRDANGYRPIVRSERIVETRDLKPKDNVGALLEPLEMPKKDLHIDPYLLGVWLGDGDSSSPYFTKHKCDMEIIDRIRERGYTVDEMSCSGKNTSKWAVRDGPDRIAFKHDLKALGLLGNKHIPAIYLEASVEQRFDLLRGLMDTDGHINARGNACFSTIREQLADSVYELATSLALRPRKTFVKQTYNGEPYPNWRIEFQCHEDRNAFYLKRKSERAIKPSLHRLCNNVVSVKQVESVETSCIQVEGGVYLIGKDMVPTHNSTIITVSQSIRDILNDPCIMICILSFNRTTAKRFLRQIKTQFEMNKRLKDLFPDILYGDPAKESIKWNEDEGIVVKRPRVMPHSTLEAYGVIDSMPTGGHYSILVYDDVVTKEAISSPEVIAKVTDSVSLSFNLSTEQGGRKRFIGTRYHYNDTYQTLIDRGAFTQRIYPATDNGMMDGEPVLWSKETLKKKLREMGPVVASAQLLCKPVMEGEEKFSASWLLRWYPRNWDRMNRYILVDPANEKGKKSDWTVMAVVGLGEDRNYYLIDMIRDKLSLSERATRLIALHRQYRPIAVGYEKYGMQGDIQYIQERQDVEQYRFRIDELGGSMAKNDRILSWLQPLFADRRFYIPETLVKQTYDRRQVDVMLSFVQDEYLAFPFLTHDDMLDCLARISDPSLAASFPKEYTGGGLNERWAEESSDRSKYEFDTYAALEA